VAHRINPGTGGAGSMGTVRATATRVAMTVLDRPTDGDRIVEHWHVIQPWPATPADDHPML
jgi:predicted SnoaL-like aldol condensation-catalyzing enzyme